LAALSIDSLFAAIDARDAEAFAAFMQEESVFRFGNAPPVQGRAAVRDSVAGFFAAIGGVRHDLEASWQMPDALLCHGTVHYTRLDGSRHSVPFANVLSLDPDSGQVRDYRIFADLSGLFADG
jgi:ketosteroid isomerase-like protein